PLHYEKHFYDKLGKMNDEEARCAQIIDGQKWVRRWVRNLESKPDASFWLQLGGARFYPDFVAELCDGRLLVVEYKGGDRIDNPDTLHKAKVGALWAERSNGRGVFLMVGVDDYIPKITAVGDATH
ncbi:MAG TPA: hypothetical protein VNA16_08210, partial [Abditibacteriaceae bacterium]|nr:hypothetical protein [Abditibacteriaceae bacterium]